MGPGPLITGLFTGLNLNGSAKTVVTAIVALGVFGDLIILGRVCV